MVEDALEVATDPDYKFELAIQLGRLEVAKVSPVVTIEEFNVVMGVFHVTKTLFYFIQMGIMNPIFLAGYCYRGAE